ncbi:signal recognition particle-docking protein FtsY [Streptococcus dentapri]|uniref:Signal recognition particle receptor FtsY n=1 Tax=Streptococcus dentapri TaxID=573564 RepID=A0ABV8CZV8_9STRE
MGLFDRLFGNNQENSDKPSEVSQTTVQETDEHSVGTDKPLPSDQSITSELAEKVSSKDASAESTEEASAKAVENFMAEYYAHKAALEAKMAETAEQTEDNEAEPEQGSQLDQGYSETSEQESEIKTDETSQSDEEVVMAQATAKEEVVSNQSSLEENQETEQEKYNRSLKKTRTGFGARLNAFFANFRRVDEEFFEELEELLILSDVGVQVATNLTEDLRSEVKLENAKKKEDIRRVVIEKLVDIYEKDGQFNEQINFQDGLTVMLFVGVNGVGKTTSIGKLAHKYKGEGKKVMLVAADTFRAGAVAQLVEWGRRVDVPVITGPEKSDPASVVFNGMEQAVAQGVDILLIDTAGRLQNKDNLMAELEKIGRIVKRVVPDAPHETLLALDASTGQNALSQAKEFSKITPLTGIVLTKIDGTAKGGVVLAIREELDIPVKFIGFGEKIDDIGEFQSEEFMQGLLSGII